MRAAPAPPRRRRFDGARRRALDTDRSCALSAPERLPLDKTTKEALRARGDE
jgi:hypothetical protein